MSPILKDAWHWFRADSLFTWRNLHCIWSSSSTEFFSLSFVKSFCCHGSRLGFTERKPNNQFLASCKRLKDYRIHKNTSAYRKKKKMQMFCQILMNSKAPSITGNSIWRDYFTILFVSPQTWMKGIQLASLHTAMFALFLPHWLSLTSIPS